MNHFDPITIEFVDTDSISIYSFLFEIFNANSLKIFIFAMQNAIHIRPNQWMGCHFKIINLSDAKVEYAVCLVLMC